MSDLHSSLARIVPDDDPGASDIDRDRLHELEARAYFQHRLVVARLDVDEMPALVRQWLLNRARERFEKGARA